MVISQHDYHTVKIVKDSLTLLLRYDLYWNGQKRLPESIVAQEAYVTAYFLTFTIRDFISETPWGLAVERTWSIMSEGEVALTFCLDLPECVAAPYLLPGVACAGYLEATQPPVSGLRTAYPSSLFLYPSRTALLLFTDPPRSQTELGSVSLERVAQEGEPYLRVEFRFPSALPAPLGAEKRRKKQLPSPPAFHSPGGLAHSLRLNLVTSAPADIHRKGLAAVLERSAGYLHPLKKTGRETVQERLEEAVSTLLSGHLEGGGALGLRRRAGESMVSSYAGLGLALMIASLYARDEERMETAFRLADFSLQGQHPCGVFFETYDPLRRRWRAEGQGGEPEAPLVSVAASARISGLLLEFSARLESMGLRAGKYRQAATRCLEVFFDPSRRLAAMGTQIRPDSLQMVGRGLDALELIPPLLQLLEEGGKDHYRKALGTLRDRFFKKPFSLLPLPAWKEGAVPDASSSLLLASSALLLHRAGFEAGDPNVLLSHLLAWIYLNRNPASAPLNPSGGILEALGADRLQFQGCELAYLLYSLSGLVRSSSASREPQPQTLKQEITQAAQQALAFSLQAPLGASALAVLFAEGGGPSPGPMDAVRFFREAVYLLKVQKEYPHLLRQAS